MLNAFGFRVAAFAIATLALGAQDTSRPVPPVAHGAMRGEGKGPLAQLGLSEAQRTQIRQIREKHKGQGPASRKEMRFEVLAVLTEAQRETLFRMEGRRRQGRGSRD